MSRIIIRAVHRDDFDQWLPLWVGYNLFYQRPVVADEITRTTWSRFFDAYEPVHAFVAEREGQLIGIVHYLFHRSTGMIEPVCYLQDLFTSPPARGEGVGRALIEAVYDTARDKGSTRVYWMTHETNTQAMALYDQVAEKSGFLQYRKQLG